MTTTQPTETRISDSLVTSKWPSYGEDMEDGLLRCQKIQRDTSQDTCTCTSSAAGSKGTGEGAGSQPTDNDFSEIFPNESVFLAMRDDLTHVSELDNTATDVFDESVDSGVDLVPIEAASNTDARASTSTGCTSTECDAFRSGQDNKSFENGDIFKKLDRAQKVAEARVREGMAAAAAEIVRLRQSHLETTRKLEEECKLWKVLARTELKKRNRLVEEMYTLTDEKIRAEHIGNEAIRQSKMLSNENARLHANLQASRQELAQVDAQRQDLRLQLTTLRATLGLLSREPMPTAMLSGKTALAPRAPAQAPHLPNAVRDALPRNLQIEEHLGTVLPDSQAASKSVAAIPSPLPAWFASTEPRGDIAKETGPSPCEATNQPPNQSPKQPSKKPSASKAPSVVTNLRATPCLVDTNVGSLEQEDESYESDFEFSSASENESDSDDGYSLVFDPSPAPTPCARNHSMEPFVKFYTPQEKVLSTDTSARKSNGERKRRVVRPMSSTRIATTLP